VTASLSTPNTSDIQATFLIHLPRIRKHADYALRHIANQDAREDLIAEALALAWKHFSELARRGKKPEEFATTLALRCTQAIRAGRRLAGSARARDVLSPIARARHGVAVVRLGDGVPAPGEDPTGPAGEEVLAGALTIDPKARVAEQAAFRVDFPAWRAAGYARSGESSTRWLVGTDRPRVSLAARHQSLGVGLDAPGIRRMSHVRLPVVVASPNTSTYFSRNCAGVMCWSAASSFTTSIAVGYLPWKAWESLHLRSVNRPT
jgi:DNA-directed RNA polymerase specialized sigma24 family protein